MCDHKCGCSCCNLCVVIPQFKSYDLIYNGSLYPEYYSSHLNVGNTDNIYQLPNGCLSNDSYQIHILRLISTTGGQALINIDHLSGPMNQIQLNMTGSFVKLLYKNCLWNIIDGENFTCV